MRIHSSPLQTSFFDLIFRFLSYKFPDIVSELTSFGFAVKGSEGKKEDKKKRRGREFKIEERVVSYQGVDIPHCKLTIRSFLL